MINKYKSRIAHTAQAEMWKSQADLTLHHLASCSFALRDAVTGGPLRTSYRWSYWDADGNHVHEQEPTGDRGNFIEFWRELTDKHLFCDPEGVASVLRARRNRQASKVFRRAVEETPHLQELLRDRPELASVRRAVAGNRLGQSK